MTKADFLNALTTDQIRSVYAGKAGKCCCGCSGTHRYNSKFRAEGSADRGYAVTDKDVNDTQVRKVLAIVNGWAGSVEDPEEGVEIAGEHISREIGGKLYIAYFTTEAAARFAECA